MKKKNVQVVDELNAVKARQRDEEIAEHGKAISYLVIERNRKKYTRKRKHKNKDDYEV